MREEIKTVRLFLREMDRNDFDALYKVLTDTETMRHYPYAFDEAWLNELTENMIILVNKIGCRIYAT